MELTSCSAIHKPNLFQPCVKNETIHEPCRVESRKHQTCHKPHVCQLVGCCCCCCYCCFCCCCFKPLQDGRCSSWFQWYMLPCSNPVLRTKLFTNHAGSNHVNIRHVTSHMYVNWSAVAAAATTAASAAAASNLCKMLNAFLGFNGTCSSWFQAYTYVCEDCVRIRARMCASLCTMTPFARSQTGRT